MGGLRAKRAQCKKDAEREEAAKEGEDNGEDSDKGKRQSGKRACDSAAAAAEAKGKGQAPRGNARKGGLAKAQKAMARAAKVNNIHQMHSSSDAAPHPTSPSKRKRPQHKHGRFVTASPPRSKRPAALQSGKRKRCPICQCRLIESQAREGMECDGPTCSNNQLQPDQRIMSCPICEEYDLCTACTGQDPSSQGAQRSKRARKR